MLGRAHALKYDAPRFSAAMERAIELTDDDTFQGDLYADLAHDTAGRGGMFPVLPATEVVEGWVDRALELAKPGSPAAAKALLARSHWRRSRGISTGLQEAIDASALVVGIDDPDLKVIALNDLVLSSVVAGEYDDALAWVERAHELIEEVRDPDIAADVPAAAAFSAVAIGRFADARRYAENHEAIASGLTPHHRVHGVAITAEVEELAGNWTAIGSMESLARERVSANLATPCIRNTRTLLLCAIAAEYAGDPERATKLEEFAREVELEGFEGALSGPVLRLALARGDRETLEQLVASGAGFSASSWFRLSAAGSRLEALAALDDRDAVESEAPLLIRPGTWLEPFALRALGQVREDDELIRQALELFEAMGLDWHATETRKRLTDGA
jgi:tetratricopeptide (TPR) repeat protein